MSKVFKYCFLDLIRSRWTMVYLLFFIITCGGLLYLSGDSAKVVVSLMNIIILLVPLISMIYGMMYMYQVRDYVEILLAQPISRKSIFGGYVLGLSAALSVSVGLGILIPLAFHDFQQIFTAQWLMLTVIAIVLTVIFCVIAAWLVLANENRLKGFGLGLFIWLLLAVIYDGIFLVVLVAFEGFPLENLALGLTLLNPVDMGRVLLIFQLDYSALMGYTGAIFEKFFGTTSGSLLIGVAFLSWIIVPLLFLLRKARVKDF
ncbi:ABC transporter permease [Owenweeksia hongkongensis]|uniref:ABC transporter permease n=1 Tax=Owenweeksia hongkongensis TaxID=253245 RepID=UPI003A8E151F